MKYFTVFIACLVLSGCTPTFSINVVHTQGSATDLIDEQQSPKTESEVSPDVKVPLATDFNQVKSKNGVKKV